MAWRFKASKYKNAAGTVAKRSEWLLDVDVGEVRTGASHPVITASSAYVVFSQEGKGSGCVGIVDADFAIEADPSVPPPSSQTPPPAVVSFHPHGALPVTCMDFSPFDDGLLATGSEDSLVKLWHLKEDQANPECLFIPQQDAGVETLRFHPTCDFLLTASAGDKIQILDLVEQKELLSVHGEFRGPVNSFDWRVDGSEIAAIDQQSGLFVLDPRKASNKPAAALDTRLTPSKENHVVWLADSGNGKVLVSGFSKTKERIADVYDVRNMGSSPLGSFDFETGIGSLVPLYDPDTSMLFMFARGESGVSYLEVEKSIPTFRSKAMSNFGTKAACLAPKRSLGVMNGEVNRVYQLSTKAVVPIRFKVPRKSYRDFHEDLFPLTRSVESVLVPDLWMAGKNIPTPKISLDPVRMTNDQAKCVRKPLSRRKKEAEEKKVICLKTETEPTLLPKENVQSPAPKPAPSSKNINNNNLAEAENAHGHGHGHVFVEPRPKKEPESKESGLRRDLDGRRSLRELSSIFEAKSADSGNLGPAKPVKRIVSLRVPKKIEEAPSEAPPVEVKNRKQKLGDSTDGTASDFQRQSSNRMSKQFGRVAKFRHLKGTVPPRAEQFENLKNVNPSLPTECDGIKGNDTYFVVSIRGPGGKVLVWPLSETGRLPDDVVLKALINASTVTDFAWDPFDSTRLAVSTDDGTINLWNVADLEHVVRDAPVEKLRRNGPPERVTVLKWHPTASNVLAAAMSDGTVDIWDVENSRVAYQVTAAFDGSAVWSFDWSPDGQHLALATKDGKLRVVEARTGAVVSEGNGFSKGRGARVLWVLGGRMIAASGFEGASARVIKLFEAKNLAAGPLKVHEMDVSPSLIVPYYDEDSSTLFLYAKGDTTINNFEVLSEDPYLYPLTPHRSGSPHQAFTLLPKKVVDVRAVEFARALRLYEGGIEPISFTVPRVKMELFQDDLFPPSRQTWLPALNGSAWLKGQDGEQPLVSMKPEGMFSLHAESAAGGDAPQGQANNVKRVASVEVQKAVPKAVPVEEELEPLEKQKQVQNSLSDKVAVITTLEQDEMEGVDAKEWE